MESIKEIVAKEKPPNPPKGGLIRFPLLSSLDHSVYYLLLCISLPLGGGGGLPYLALRSFNIFSYFKTLTFKCEGYLVSWYILCVAF
jgi:hypothetical protein